MTIRRRRLPHQDVADHPVFITACLEGSLSEHGFSRIEKYRSDLETRPRPAKVTLQEWKHQNQKRLFAFVDELLDGHSPVCHLKDERQAAMRLRLYVLFRILKTIR